MYSIKASKLKKTILTEEINVDPSYLKKKDRLDFEARKFIIKINLNEDELKRLKE
jgi:hypothetical protein